MAKKQAAKMADTVDALRPYLERAMHDDEFRRDLKDAMQAAKELYGPLSKKSKNGGVAGSARVLATDKKAQEQLRRAFDDLASAAETLQGKKKKKSHKGRKMLLLAGVVAGALYNPWTGPQTREKLLDLIAGDDDLQPLADFGDLNGDSVVADATDADEGAVETVEDAADAASDVADSAKSAVKDAKDA